MLAGRVIGEGVRMAGNRYSPRIAAAVAAALGLSAPVGAAFAQPVAADGTVLEEIIVTATRREANVQDVPFNMVALGPESLEKLRITNLAEFTRAVPGLYVPDQGPRSSNLITVRGLNVSSLTDTIAIGNGTEARSRPTWATFRCSSTCR